MPTSDLTNEHDETRDPRPRRTTETRDIRAAARTAPSPSFHFCPRQTKSGESHQQGRRRSRRRTAARYPRPSRPRHRLRGSEVQPPPRSSPERPRTREQEPRLTSNRLGFTKFVPCHCRISDFLSTFLAASVVNRQSKNEGQRWRAGRPGTRVLA